MTDSPSFLCQVRPEGSSIFTTVGHLWLNTFVFRNSTNSFLSLLVLMQDCGQLHALGETETGKYKVRPNPAIENDIYVYCDHDTDGGGWLILQRRSATGTLNMTQHWHLYRDGFGNVVLNFGSVTSTSVNLQITLLLKLCFFLNVQMVAFYERQNISYFHIFQCWSHKIQAY